MKSVTVTEMVRNFSDYINRVVCDRESFLLRKGRRPVAELRPISSGRTLGDLPEILASLPRLSREEADAFAEDLSRIRQSILDQAVRDPWQS
jgi:antitoxin (DNA-binding transcriptional repressor) of toxin-antitoxin stability system